VHAQEGRASFKHKMRENWLWNCGLGMCNAGKYTSTSLKIWVLVLANDFKYQCQQGILADIVGLISYWVPQSIHNIADILKLTDF